MSCFLNIATLLPFGNFRQLQFPKDGNSFYRAISQEYYRDQNFHLLLRRSLVEDIQYDKNYISKFPTLPHMSSIVHEHKQKMHWHIDLEPVLFYAMSQFLNLRLVIYSEMDDKTITKIIHSSPTFSQTIHMFQTANHFVLLVKG